ncbi:arginine--tRNA ligase [candidate division KSB1 bacterium]|nr:arginine--tRNA ligase [candidate division KSB1 bacterium]RQW00155.1 MAG: arginine--tRNA ligase [candidate division KSB1 bacterium]
MTPREHIQAHLKKAFDKLGFNIDDASLFTLEQPKVENFGDLACTAAMTLARVEKKAPRRIAQEIIANYELDPFYIDRVDLAGPGFINFYLAPACLQRSVIEILAAGEDYGRSAIGAGERVQLEFVSANPTGPLNVVSARAASVGDVMTNLLNAAGYRAVREYYVNDAGRQVRLLGASLDARYLTALGDETPVPEDGYHGDYLRELANEILESYGESFKNFPEADRQQTFSQKALEYMLARHKKSMERFGVYFDVWFRESQLRKTKEHLEILKKLKAAGFIYEKDDAVWFKSSEFGDEKDRVLVTGDKRPTYFFVDVAYHENKFKRGFDRLIDFWGPDHHGYIPRMSAALQALGHPKHKFQVEIIQQVNLLRDSQPVKMSKRAGEIIEMDELIDEVGVDASRFFFVDRRTSQQLDFDIELAKREDRNNPVWYVQYAHARTCNIFKKAHEKGYSTTNLRDTSALTDDFAMAIIKKLIDFPDIVAQAAQTMEPHRLPNYLKEVAAALHRFYHHQIVLDADDKIRESRLLLTDATRQVLANGLKLMGISAPTYMAKLDTAEDAEIV